MPISVVSSTPDFVPATIEVEHPAHAAALLQHAPLPALGTTWHVLYSDQLVGVLQSWFRSGSFSRRSRRAYAKLNIAMRSADQR